MSLKKQLETRNLPLFDKVDRPVKNNSSSDYLRAVHIILLDSSGKVCLQVTGNKHRHPGLIGSSVAGFVDRGESYIQAAERRIKEELGISPPLSKIGNIRVPEEGKYKFSEIYTGDAAGAKNNMPGHVGSLESFDINEVVASYKKDPARFTPSFVYIFGLFLLVYQSELHLE